MPGVNAPAAGVSNSIMNEPSKTNPEQVKGIVASIFDLSFTDLITPKIIKWLYLMGIIAAGLFAGGWVLKALSGSFFIGMISLVCAPVVFVFYVLSTRMALELVMAIFQLAESMKKIEERMK
jgi:Domain of unknown function (DUF4282)